MTTPGSPPSRVLYNLFWCTEPRAASAVVAAGPPATISRLPPVEAIILYPAFLTPAVCSQSSRSFFELLLLAPKGLDSSVHPMNVPAHRGDHGGTPADRVNRHLKISSFLDPQKWATPKPLFDEQLTDSLVKVVELGKITDGSPKLRDAIVATDELFRGTVHARFWDALQTWQQERKKEAKKRKAPAPDELDTLFKIRVDLKCLKNIGPSQGELARRIAEARNQTDWRQRVTGTVAAPPDLWENVEAQDELIRSVMNRRNGPDLKTGYGFFVSPRMVPESLQLSCVSTDQAVRAYHPLFVHADLGFANIGHIADLHVNSRQNFLARTPARVVEASPEPPSPGAEAPGSQPIGNAVNIYSDNVVSILEQLAQGERGQRGHRGRQSIDVLLVGGDLIDHVKNVYPYGSMKASSLRAGNVNAAGVWDVVDLGTAKHYQPFVDYLSVFSILRYFCETHQKPVFVVAGNHDAYEEAYGISPRPAQQLVQDVRPASVAAAVVQPMLAPAAVALALVPDSKLAAAVRANEGIPADHNLTFYESILAFGDSFYNTPLVSALRLHPELLEWFYAVFTPFADFDVALPKQRIVGLAWGESEGKLLKSDLSDEHGMGHLPRADGALTAQQVEFFDGTFADGARKVVLFTHFTFVSYKNEFPNFSFESTPKFEAPTRGKVSAGAEADGASSFSRQDWGTFEKRRKVPYEMLHASPSGGPGSGPHLHCVLTGHSHRRGLYYVGNFQGYRKHWTLDTRYRLPWVVPLGPLVLAKRLDEGVFDTLMYPIDGKTTPVWLLEHKNKTPIIVSDSAGPLPRANIYGEFGQWGSDRPSGTYVGFGSDGVVDQVEAVPAVQQARTRPRAAIAIDYLHVNDGHGIVSIVGDEFGWDGPYPGGVHWFEVTFHDQFARASVQVVSAMIHGKPNEKDPIESVTLQASPPPAVYVGQLPSPVARLNVDPRDNAKLLLILNAAKLPRFMSLRFKARFPLLDEIYDFAAGGRWDFEIDCTLEGSPGPFRWKINPKVELPDFKLRRKYFPAVYGTAP